jgi:hypothetical protein
MSPAADASITEGSVDDEPAPRRGRPASGAAKSSTERNRQRRERIAREGGSAIHVMLDARATKALAALRKGGATIDEAVSAALLAAAGMPTR